MRNDLLPPEEPALRSSGLEGRHASLARAGVALLSLALLGSLYLSNDAPPVVTFVEVPSTAQVDVIATLEADAARALPALESEALDRLRGAFRDAAAPAVPESAALEALATEEPSAPFAEQAPIAPPEEQPSDQSQLTQVVPLPVQRPFELRRAQDAQPRMADRRSARRARVAAAPVAPPDDRNFFEKMFGIERPASPALAYAALETPSVDRLPRQRLTPTPVPTPGASGGVAVYDITARTVTLPNGERLEAHSGLGSNMDDPRYVNQRMRGATPPGTYDLTEREQLFHGVRAIRLTPVGGSEAVYGRVGLLAHTYMLGPQGASNGCVSFRDYNKFLQAYLRGEIQRLVVVPGRSDGVPTLASQPSKAPARSARVGGDA